MDQYRECEAPANCYSRELDHAVCNGGHPIHFDNTGRYETSHWVHCLIVDVVMCPFDSEPVLDYGYQARHDSGAISG